jgi:hypothetical protein
MLEVFATLGSLWLVAKGVGWAANAPTRAMNSLTGLAQQRLNVAYQRAALLVSQAQVQLAGAPDTPEVRQLRFQLQRTYELAVNRNPGAFVMINEMQKAYGSGQRLTAAPATQKTAVPQVSKASVPKMICPQCGKDYGKGRPFCQYCGFHANSTD